MTPKAFHGEWWGREVRVAGLRGSGARASEGEGRALGKAEAGHSPTPPDHPPCFSILAQVSRSETERLKTSLPAAESGSVQK